MNIKKLFLLSSVIAGVGTFALNTAAVAQSSQPLSVVASFSVLGDMVQQVGGELVDLNVLVDANADVHVYTPTPADARALSGADLLIVNGLAFEGWLPRLVEAAGYAGPTIVATTNVVPIAFEDEHGDEHQGEEEHDDEHHEGEEHKDEHHDDEHHEGDEHHEEDEHHEDETAHHDEHDDDHKSDHGDEDHGDDHGEEEHHEEGEHHEEDEHGHGHGAFDPHGWHSLSVAQIYAQTITDALVAADPANAATYQRNGAAYIAQMAALDAQIKADLSEIPVAQRVVVTSHDAFGYFEDAYGVEFLAPQGLSTESEASAQDVANIIRQIREQGIKAVFVENVSDPRLIKQIASETDASVGGKLYSDSLSSADEPGATYLQMMRHNADQIVNALR